MNKLFKALNDPARREMLNMLRKGDLTAGEIADAFDMSKPSVSHHLNLLKEAGLAVAERDGQYLRYSLNMTALDEALQWLLAFRDGEKENGKPKS